MSPTVGNSTVEVVCAPDTWTLRWPRTGITLGPCRSFATVDGTEDGSGSAGIWHVDRDGAGGAAARWHSDSGLTVTVRIDAEGPVAIVEAEVSAGHAAVVDRVTPLLGSTSLAYSRRLVEGYDSWGYSGVRGPEPGSSCWGTALVAADGQTLALQAIDARRLCTQISADGTGVRVDCGASPSLTAAPGTWGYRIGDTPPLGLPVDAGEALRAVSVALVAATDPFEAVETLSTLAGAEMGARAWSGPPMHGWESWYQYGLTVSAEQVVANATVLRARYDRRTRLQRDPSRRRLARGLRRVVAQRAVSCRPRRARRHVALPQVPPRTVDRPVPRAAERARRRVRPSGLVSAGGQRGARRRPSQRQLGARRVASRRPQLGARPRHPDPRLGLRDGQGGLLLPRRARGRAS